MNQKRIALAAAVAVFAALTVGSLAPARSATAGRAAAAHAGLRVFDVDGPITRIVDLGAKGLGAGDSLFEVHPVIDPGTGKLIGSTVTHVVVVRTLGTQGNLLGIIDCTVRLPGGKLVFYGALTLADLANGVTLPVTGGTGAYLGARGAVVLQSGKVGGRAGTFLSFDLR